MATLYYERPDYNTLQHHGILGQKWGVRRFQNPDGTWTEAGKERYGEDSHTRKVSNEDSTHNKSLAASTKERKHLTEGQKKAIKIGIAVTATAAITAGAVIAYKKSPAVRNAVNSSLSKLKNVKTKDLTKDVEYAKLIKDVDNRLARNMFSEIKGGGLSEAKAIKSSIINPTNSGTNCGNCALAFEMKMRGKDVFAKENYFRLSKSEMYQHFDGLTDKSFIHFGDKLYKIPNPDVKNPKQIIKRGETIKKTITDSISSQYEDDCRGAIFVNTFSGSHWMNWVKENGKVEFFDTQDSGRDIDAIFRNIRTTVGDKNNRSAIRRGSETMTIRLDNLTIKDSVYELISKTGESINDLTAEPVAKGTNWVSVNRL